MTVIHGPNGVGKTIVLRMIHEALTGDTNVFERIPFERFELRFASEDELVLEKSSSEEGKQIIEYSMTVASKEFHGVYQTRVNDEKASRLVGLLDQSVGGDWTRHEGGFIDRNDSETLSYSEAITRLEKYLPDEILEAAKLNHQLSQIRAKCNVRLIGTDRLTDAKLVPRKRNLRRRRPRQPSSDNRTIGRYSLDLVDRIKNAHFEYGRLTERLDRSLIKRLLAKDFVTTSAEDVLGEFKSLDKKRRQLTELGLLTETEDVIQSEGDSDVIELVEGRLDVFSIYVSDMRQKLSIFDSLGEKLRILLDRTRMRFQFKSLEIDSERGLVFKSHSGSTLAVSDLSSGEQHEMIFFYDLLFFAGNEDLILIDEPEISLHIEWQMEFMNDLKTALKASNAHVLVATHSPAIAEAAGESLIELGG